MKVFIFSRKKLITTIGLSLTLIIQYHLWTNKNGIINTYHLHRLILMQNRTQHQLQQANQILFQHIQRLKTNYAFLEEKARSELGMIKTGETLYRFSESHEP